MSEVADNVFDVVVSGGGLVGASVALGLADRGLNIALIEPTKHNHQPLPSHDERTLVLNAASLNVLDNLDLLPDDLICVPVRHIHINRQHGFGHLHLDADDYAEIIAEDTDATHPYFGQVVVARALGQCMLDRLAKHPGIQIFCPQALVGFQDSQTHVNVSLDDGQTLSTRVLVGADGTQSLIRQQLGLSIEDHDYGQRAMVFNVAAEKPMPETAFERFTAQGPLALLPQAQGRYGVVWIDETQAIDEALEWSDETLMSALHERFGPRLGVFSKPSPRASYPLIKQHCPQVVSGRVVVVGNAANAVHPVSAQGFNLGLRDVAGLIDAICPAIKEDLDRPHTPTQALRDDTLDQALLAYQGIRANDQRATIRYTDTLARTFAHPTGLVRLMGGMGLAAHAASPTLTRRLVRAAMGFREPVASLAKKHPNPSRSQHSTQAHPHDRV